MKNSLYYVTSNVTKFEEATHILGSDLLQKTAFRLEQRALFLDEIQGKADEVALHKTKTAFALSGGCPVIIDDVSLYIDALSGLPGPYIKTFLEQLGSEGLWNLVSKLGATTCRAVCMIGFMQSEREGPRLFSGSLYGNLSPPKGKRACGTRSWNSIFTPRGETRSTAEMSMEEFNCISPRAHALRQLREFLLIEGAPSSS